MQNESKLTIKQKINRLQKTLDNEDIPASKLRRKLKKEIKQLEKELERDGRIYQF